MEGAALPVLPRSLHATRPVDDVDGWLKASVRVAGSGSVPEQPTEHSGMLPASRAGILPEGYPKILLVDEALISKLCQNVHALQLLVAT